MARLDRATPLGALHVVGWQRPTMEAAAALALADAARGGFGLDVIDFEGRRAYFKRSVLRGLSRWRWGARRALFFDRVPRVREYYNLCWLTERLFVTPLPIAAGTFTRAGLPTWQFLLTEELAPARTLEAFAANEFGPDRTTVLETLARETARMHGLGFVHHDLYPRNVLVLPIDAPQRVAFLDAWAGGPAPQWRDAAYDLACLFLDTPRVVARSERDRFLRDYAEERAAQGRPIEQSRFVARAARARRALVARLERRPSELRGQLPPEREW